MSDGQRDLPLDWFDGRSKPCPGTPRFRYLGVIHEDGEQEYLCRCSHCDVPLDPDDPAPHDFVPVRPDAEFTVVLGKVLFGCEAPEPAPSIDFESLARSWREISDEQRLQLIEECCRHCGKLDPFCQCWNDD